MLQPKKDNFRLNQADQASLEKEMIAYAEEGATDADLIEFKNTYVAEKKKATAQSNATSTPQKSVSGTPTGSSGGVNPAFKNTTPSPIPDFNSMQSVKSVVQKPQVKLQKPAFLTEDGVGPTFMENVVSTVKSKINKLATGSSQLGADYASTPELLYDAFAMPQNAIADYFDMPSLRADSEKFKKNIGVRNAVKEYYQGEVIKLREHAKQVDTQYQDGIYDSFKNGDVLGGFDQLTNSFAESLAATSSIMMGGAFAKAPQLLATSSMVFGAGKNEQLKDENPDMNTNARVVNALATGLAEGAFETIGSGSIGAAARGIIEREGAKKGAIILKDGLTNIYKATIAKNPLLASMGVEGGTEWATKVTQNSIDVATGVKPQDFNVFDGATDALIGGIFGGTVFGAGLKGLENVANSKDKTTIKSNVDKTFELQKALENPDISETTKVELEKGIEKLVKTNQELVKKNVEHADNLHPKVKEKLVEAVTKSDEIKESVKAIKLDNGTNDFQKQILLDGLKDDFKKHIQLKADILDGKTTPVDVLPLKEQDKIKRQALKELTAEQNPDGKKSIKIDNAQILERANKIYKENEQNSPATEAQPQAEVPQQAEAEKVAEVSPEVADIEKRRKNDIERYDESDKRGIEKINPDAESTKGSSFKVGTKWNDGYKAIINSSTADENYIGSDDPYIVISKIIKPAQFDESGIMTKAPVVDVMLFNNKEEADKFIKERLEKVKLSAGKRQQKANEKYDAEIESLKNKETPKPQEVSPVEDVVATSVEKRKYNFTKTPSLENAQAIEIKDANIDNEPEITEKIINNQEHWDKALVDGVKNEGNGWFEVGKTIQGESVLHAPSTNETVVIKDSQNKGGRNGAYKNNFIENNPRNEATPETNTPTNGNVQLGASNVGESGNSKQESPVQESVSSSVDGGEVKGDVEVVKKVKSVKGATYDVHFDGDGNISKIISPKNGREIIKFTEREVNDTDAKGRKQYNKDGSVKKKKVLVSNPNYAQIEADALGLSTANKAKADKKVDFKTAAENIPENDPYSVALKALVNGEKVSFESIVKETGNKDGKWATNQSDKSLPSIEKLSEQLWEKNPDLDQQEIRNAIIDIISSHSNINSVKESVIEIYNENAKKQQDQELNAFLGNLSEKDMAMYEAVTAEDSYISELSDKEVEEYYNQKLNEYEQATETLDEKPNPSTQSDEKQAGAKEKPTTKEKIAERIKLSDAKVDDIKAHIKGIDNIFGIKIKIDDVEGLNKNGIDFVEVIASIAKQAIAAGIHIDEAINKTIEHFKGKYDFDVNIDDIKERINPKKEAEKDFKSKKGKKSLLGRLIEGGNPDVITKAVKELGENYDVRNQEEANDEAMAFIDKVGASEALKAIKDGLITNSDVKMLIYDEAITRLKTEISDEMDNNPEDREALIKKFQEVSDDFDKAIRDAGQGIAIMNYIYNKNQTLKYNLKKQISDWKRNDPNGEIPADIKAKFEELDQKLKDIEERSKDAEERAKKAEDELVIKNIQEDVERKNQVARKNKSGLTPQEQNRKKQLRDKFARANDVTGIPALLVDPEFREYLGLVLKTAKGDFANFSNEILKDLGKTARQHLPELFTNAGGKGDVKVTDLQSITISEEGKIKIPAQMLRDYVEQGYTDIDEIAALIKDDIADEFPDADVRDIRDALTGYGKQINPNKDEITAQVNKLKEYGRLLSAYDDVMNGEMPKKSGLVRPKSEQKARELRRNINRLAKELNLEPVDLENQWANAVDKVKSHLKNQIEDLDKQIANGEKRKIDRTPIKLDEEATALKAIRDAKKQILDDLVGKPELTEEQKIANAEKSLDNSIKKLQEEIDTNDIAFKEKPTAVTSKKIEQLKANKKALLETKKQLRQEAGLIEQQRLKTTKTRIKNQIEDLNTRIKNKDFAKKEVKPILADSELNTLRAEKETVYEEYEKMKYLQELKNRTFAKKLMDEGLEALGLARAIKASLDLGLIGIQLRGFTYSELWRNPKELAHKFIKMFGAIGSQNKTNKAMSELIGHPLHALAKKLDIGMTHPDLRNEVREEMASGNLLHFIWSSPVLAVEALGGKEAMNSKRTSIGDSFIDSVKKQYNKLFQNYQVDIKQKEKFSVKEQWKNINAFEAVERGLSIYGNQLRFEEFVRGVDRLKAEGKDEINHLEDYKALASYIRTFSGRAKPAGFELNQKALNVFFFSFKNMASVIQQLNPIYYGLQHTRSTDFKNGNYFKPTVANKMAMATMFKSVVSTSATLLFVMAAYNAFKDDDEEEATIEKDPRSSDFGKLKIGTFRYDPWGGYVPLITLYARLWTESYKKDDGKIYKFGEEYNKGKQNIADAVSDFLVNKESPAYAMAHKFTKSHKEIDKTTGETTRMLNGKPLLEDDSFNFSPIFLNSVAQAKEKDYEGVQAFLTAYSVLGLGNVQDYENKEKKPKSSKKGVPGVPNFGRMKINP